MSIHRLMADGKKVQFHQAPSSFMPNTSELTIDPPVPHVLFIEYSGEIKSESYPPIISSVNMINFRLAELAMYVCWYPKLKSGALFEFNLEVNVPTGFVTATNARFFGEKSGNNRSETSWKSYEPGFDIALLSGLDLKKSVVSDQGMSVEIYFDKVPQSYVDSIKRSLLVAMDRLTTLLGSPHSAKLIRVAYSPRKTWGYVRRPFIIVSEDNTLTWRSQKYGPARDFRYLTHEMSHYWWHYADINTPDDWINEGLAEYSALLVSEDVIGRDFSDQLLAEYAQRAMSSKAAMAIAETENNSPDREVNRYDKPAILFNEARVRFGDDGMKALLKALYTRFSESGKATTEIFLLEAGKELGPEGKEFFSKALFQTTWKGEATN
jgi:hypothetical protein